MKAVGNGAAPKYSVLRFEPPNMTRMLALCGPVDSYLRLVAKSFSVRIEHRGDQLFVQGDPQAVENAEQALHQLYQLTAGGVINSEQVQQVTLGQLGSDNSSSKEPGVRATDQDIEDFDPVLVQTPKIKIRPSGLEQKSYLEALLSADLCFGVGPAGVGKTWLAMAVGVQALQAGEVERIVLVRPAVEAGEKLGFLPGDMVQKVEPYQKPLYDALFEFLGRSRAEALVDEGAVEVLPLAYMRGRTLQRSFILLDESQNATVEQMKMMLTRLGNGSRIVVTGDLSQSDLPANTPSGLQHALDILSQVPGVAVSYLTELSVVRHPLVRRIIRAYSAQSAHQQQMRQRLSSPQPDQAKQVR
ncbi:MAG: PhoH family protein [Gammaproteobacteria bacterium]